MNDVKGTGEVGKTQRHRNYWTAAEITFVEQHYSQLSAREIGERLGWSAHGGARIAQLSDLSRGVMPPWTETELALMRAYSRKGIDSMTLLFLELNRH